MILFFRGKAATGKSTAAALCAQRLGAAIVSKDSVFDGFLKQGHCRTEANALAYDALVLAIKEAQHWKQTLIVDIGLAHTPYFEDFLKKVALQPSERRLFLFTCSDDPVWEKRIQARIDSPEAPNQSFKSVRAAKAHYAAYAIVPLKGEHLVDSVQPPEQLVDSLFKHLDAGDNTACSKEACIF